MSKLAVVVLACVVTTAAVYDLRWRRIPNWVSIIGLLAGLLINGITGKGAGFWSGILGVACALIVYFPLYLLRGMGAGDVKLMAAVAVFPHDQSGQRNHRKAIGKLQ